MKPPLGRNFPVKTHLQIHSSKTDFEIVVVSDDVERGVAFVVLQAAAIQTPYVKQCPADADTTIPWTGCRIHLVLQRRRCGVGSADNRWVTLSASLLRTYVTSCER